MTETMTVFKFKIFFDVGDTDAQVRYVVAETEEEAIAKFEAYLEKKTSAGMMKPWAYSLNPTVEIDEVIC